VCLVLSCWILLGDFVGRITRKGLGLLQDRVAKDSEIEGTMPFAHQLQDCLATRVALGSCLCEELEECTSGAEGTSIGKGRLQEAAS